jgi:hypothetical protein
MDFIVADLIFRRIIMPLNRAINLDGSGKSATGITSFCTTLFRLPGNFNAAWGKFSVLLQDDDAEEEGDACPCCLHGSCPCI